MASRLSPGELEELAADAQDVLNNKAMKRVFEDMERQYVSVLKSTNVGDLTATTAHASLRVLEDMKAQLKLYTNKRV